MPVLPSGKLNDVYKIAGFHHFCDWTIYIWVTFHIGIISCESCFLLVLQKGFLFTWEELEPATNMENCWWAEEEEEEHGTQAQYNDDHWEAHEDCSSSKSGIQDGVEILKLPFANDLLSNCAFNQAAVFPKAKVTCSFWLHSISYPLGLNEDHHIDDGKAECKDTGYKMHLNVKSSVLINNSRVTRTPRGLQQLCCCEDSWMCAFDWIR